MWQHLQKKQINTRSCKKKYVGDIGSVKNLNRKSVKKNNLFLGMVNW
jgi:hypothetical protein